MHKHSKTMVICLLLAASFWFGSLLSDRQALNDRLIRLHVVANSDSDADQNVKLQVRDAVIASLKTDLENVTDVDAAREYLQENLPKLQKIADNVLRKAGFSDRSVVTLCRETFDKRIYDTFTLPAGVYESLRITIGEGKGHNWWCVAFPSLCLPATTDGFHDAAVEAGLSDTLTGALTGENYHLRFYLLEALGRLENALFQSNS